MFGDLHTDPIMSEVSYRLEQLRRSRGEQTVRPRRAAKHLGRPVSGRRA